MILTGLLTVVKVIIKAIFSGINIPTLDSLDSILTLAQTAAKYACNLIDFIIPVSGSTMLAFIAIIIALHYFEEIYGLGEWLYNKIPFIH